MTAQDPQPLQTIEDYWVCPKWNCSSCLIFDEPWLPCAYHGNMVRTSQAPLTKKAYRWFKIQRKRLTSIMKG